MSLIYNSNAQKKATNVTINTDLLSQAKEMRINVSATLEIALAEAVRQKKIESWKEESRESIQSYNAHIEEYGLFSDGARTF